MPGGRYKFSQGNTRAAKLTGMQVMEIREKYAAGTHTQGALSREYLVSISTIRNIVHGVTWQQLAGVLSDEELELRAKISEKKFVRDQELGIVGEVILPPADLRERMLAEQQAAGKAESGKAESEPNEDILAKYKRLRGVP
jgi:hypothetical protein